MNLESQIERMAEKLPEGWSVSLTVEKDAAWVTTNRPDGTSVHLYSTDGDLTEQFEDALDLTVFEATGLKVHSNEQILNERVRKQVLQAIDERLYVCMYSEYAHRRTWMRPVRFNVSNDVIVMLLEGCEGGYLPNEFCSEDLWLQEVAEDGTGLYEKIDQGEFVPWEGSFSNPEEEPVKTVTLEGETFEAYKSNGRCHRQSDDKPCFFKSIVAEDMMCTRGNQEPAFNSTTLECCGEPMIVWMEKQSTEINSK